MTRFFAILILAAGLRAQTVQGVTVNAITHKPVAGANVLLISAEEKEDERDADIYRTQSDSAGRFRFNAVAAGRYRAIADAQGFTHMAFGSNIVAGTPRILVDPSVPREVTIPMTPASVISGRIADQDGDPMSYVSVEALQYGYRGGKRTLLSISTVRTDDRGQYRLFGLKPGRYYVRATQRAGGLTGYAPLYFPGVREIAQATLLEAAPGAELESTNIALRQESLYSITGRVLDAQTGQSAGSTYVTARTTSGDFTNGGPQLGDTFTIHGLLPGKYILHAQLMSGGALKTASQPVDLGNADLTGVQLMLTPGIEVTGTVRVGAELPENPQKLHIMLQPDEAYEGIYSGSLNAQGAFAFQNVRPAGYHLLWTLPKGSYVKSVKLGDLLLRDDHVDLSGRPAPLAIQLATDGGRVQGTVKNADGQPVPGAVVTMTADPSYDFWSAEADDKGHFEIRDIAPGSYKLLAFEDPPQGAPQDDEFRKPYEKRAVVVQVLPSTQQQVDLVAITVE